MKKPTLIETYIVIITSMFVVFLVFLLGLLASQLYVNLQKSKLDLKKEQLQYEILKSK